MSMTDPPTPQEEAAASRRYDATVQRGTLLRRRRRLTAMTAVGAGVLAVAIALPLTLAGAGQSKTNVRVVSPPRHTAAPSTAPRSEPSTTLPSPSTTASPEPSTTTTTVPIAEATRQLDDYLAGEAATDTAAAKAAGQTWNGYLHSPPVPDAGSLVAVAAFSYEPSAKPLEVLVYAGGRWTQAAALPSTPVNGYNPPPGAAMSSFWLANYPGAAISVADVTRDGRPDFLIPMNAADNVPGAVVSQDGTPGGAGWRYVPYTEGSGSGESYEFFRDARFQGDTLLTTYDNCKPDCAQGTDYTITWTYESKTGLFWAPSPP